MSSDPPTLGRGTAASRSCPVEDEVDGNLDLSTVYLDGFYTVDQSHMKVRTGL